MDPPFNYLDEWPDAIEADLAQVSVMLSDVRDWLVEHQRHNAAEVLNNLMWQVVDARNQMITNRAELEEWFLK